jgi:subtilisin family serine protease
MSIEDKISPAFDPLLAERKSNEKIDAIVIYESPKLEDLPTLEELRSNKTRLSYLKERAKHQQAIQAQLFESYQTQGAKHFQSHEEPAIAQIGSGALPVAAVEVTRSSLPMLARHPNVVAILPNQRVRLIQPQDVSYELPDRQELEQGATWGLQYLEIPELWETTKGAGVRVAVLDTGVYGEHPALQDRVKEFVVIDPLGRTIKTSASFDSDQHGTHVCGTIAGGQTPQGLAIGVAPEADLVVGGVLNGSGTTIALVRGLVWAVENGAQVINMSLGFSYYDPRFGLIFEELMQQYGIASVVAIGNSNHGNSCSPGNAYSAFAVGAVGRMSRNRADVAFFSSGASLVYPDPNHQLVTKPDIVAPGCNVYSCIPPEGESEGHEYAVMDGTSMATPHVSGAIALLMAAKPDVPTTAILEALCQTAKHPDGDKYRPDNRWGYGLIQPLEALEALNS